MSSVKAVLEHMRFFDVDAPDPRGNTPLHYCASSHNHCIVCAHL